MEANDMNIKDKDKQIVDRRIDALKTIYTGNLIVGCLMALFALAVISLLIFFPQTESWWILIIGAGSIGFGVLSVRGFILARKYKMMHDTLSSVNPDDTEAKELFCYKFDFLSNVEGDLRHNRYNRNEYVYTVCVNTVHGKYYYVLEKEISHISISVYCHDLYSGEHKFEVYKGTNIIKSFPDLEKVLRSIPQKFLDN